MRNAIIILFIYSLTLFTGKYLNAQEHENIELVGSIYSQWDSAYDIDVVGDIAYIAAAYSGLRIVNTSNPENPVEIGYNDTPSIAVGVAVLGDYAYVAAYYDGLCIISVANPQRPEIVGYCDTPGIAWAVTVSGEFAYVVNWSGGLSIISVANPQHPEEVTYYGDWLSGSRDVAIIGDYAIVANEYSGLRVISIEDPENPEQVDDLVGSFLSIAVSDHCAFVLNDRSGLSIFALDNLPQIREIGRCETHVQGKDVYVWDDYAYVAAYNGGLQIISVANPRRPERVGFCDTEGNSNAVTVSGNHAFIAGLYNGLRVISVVDSENPEEVGSYDTDGLAFGITLSGNFAYVANGENGLRILSVANPEHPEEVGHFDTESWVMDVVVSGNYAYLADLRGGLRIISVDDPEQPEEVGFYVTPGSARAIEVSGDYAYIADDTRGLRVISIADPEHPEEVGFCDNNGKAYGVSVFGDYACIADYRRGLRVISIADPENPFEVGFYDTEGRPYDVKVLGDYAYVADFGEGLRIISVVDPENPVEVGYYDIAWYAVGIEILGDYAYVADYWDGLSIISIANPEHPERVGFYDTPGKGCDVCVSEDGLMYVADYTNVGIYQFNGDDVLNRHLIIPFEENWNIISINVSPGDALYQEDEDRGPNVILMMDQLRIDEDNHHILLMKNEDGQFYSPIFNFNNIPYWDLTEGYQVKVDESVDAIWAGDRILADAEIPLERDWNFIAFYPTYELDASNPDYYVLSPIIDHVVMAKDGDGNFMLPAFDFSNMPPWRETQGYQVRVDEDVVLNYPVEQEEVAYVCDGSINRPLRDGWAAVSTAENMSLLVNSISGKDLPEGSQITAISSDGTVVGSGFVDANGRCGLAVWGDDPETDRLDGLTEGEMFELRVWDAEKGVEFVPEIVQFLEGDALVYEPDGLVVLDLKSQNQIPTEYYLASAFPNPFNSVTKISYGLPEATHVAIRVFDISGRLVSELINETQSSGTYSVCWNARDVASGVYVLRLVSGGREFTQKVVLMR
jgi:hypothetical protein